MRRFLVGAGLFVAVALTVVVSLPYGADALNIKSSGAVQAREPGETIFSHQEAISYMMPKAYTIYSYDGEDFYLSRFIGTAYEDPPIYVPAGKSFLFPAPTTLGDDGSGYSHLWKISAHTDSVATIPWYE